MIIYYGGLKFEVVRLIDFIRQPILDSSGVDYLFTKFIINAIALCNSQQDPYANLGQALGMSYVKEGSFVPGGINDIPSNVVQESDGSFSPNSCRPVFTDLAIRHWLKVPRRQLFVTDGQGNQILRSPRPNFFVDANNGPKVSLYNIQEVLGDARTFVVNFQIETYINECEEAENRSIAGRLAPLVSNRFSQYHELDEDYYLTVVTQGKAQFRTDLVYAQPGATTGVNPDSLRHYLFLPIPYGFKRENIKIWGDPGANGLNYQFVDIQKPYQFVDGQINNATRAIVNYTESIQSGDMDLGAVVNVVERYFGLKANQKFAKDHADKPPPGGGGGSSSKGKGGKGP